MKQYEVLIIGAGPAGLSAALTLGRLNRSALICDNSQPRNRPSSHVNNFIALDGIHPNQWRQMARENLKKYPSIEFFNGTVKSVQNNDSRFTALLETSDTNYSFSFKKIILAYGIKDKLLPLEGFNVLWGKSIFHCPFCHGYEIKGSKMGLIIKNEMAFHSLPLISSLTDDFILFTDGKSVSISSSTHEFLTKKNISIVEDEIAALMFEGEQLQGLEFKNRSPILRDYLFYAQEAPFLLKSDIGQSLGCRTNDLGLYEVNEFNKTNIEGVFACGDNMTLQQSVLFSSANGAKAAMGALAELIHES